MATARERLVREKEAREREESPLLMASSRYQLGSMGFSHRFSPFEGDQRILVGTAERFDLSHVTFPVGRGSIVVLEYSERGDVVRSYSAPVNTGVQALTWSSCAKDIVASGELSGEINLWNLANLSSGPIDRMKEHQGMIRTVDWSPSSQEIISVSKDCTMKLWVAGHSSRAAYRTFMDEPSGGGFLSAVFNPHKKNVSLSTSWNGVSKLWDTRVPTFVSDPIVDLVFQLPSRKRAIFSCDWSKSDENIFATTGADRKLRIWDIRKTLTPVADIEVKGSFGGSRVRLSHHWTSLALVCSAGGVDYFDWLRETECQHVKKPGAHRLETMSVDTNKHIVGLMSSTGLDGLVCMWYF